MSIFTVRLRGITRSNRLAAYYYIDSICRVIQMYWIYAVANTTKMIQYFSCNRPYEESVGRAVSAMVCVIKPESAIAVPVFTPKPKPTGSTVVGYQRVDGDLTKKPNQYLGVYGKSGRIFWNHLSLRYRFNGLGFRGLTHREALSF